MPDQMPPPQGQPQPEGGEEKGGAQALVEGIHTDLMKLMELAGQVSPGAAQKLEAVIQGFQGVVADMLNGGGEPEQAPAPKGPTQGGPGAVPV